jgi:hypothetical protein
MNLLVAAVAGLDTGQNDLGVTIQAALNDQLIEGRILLSGSQSDAIQLQSVVAQRNTVALDELLGSSGAIDDLSGNAIQIVTIRNRIHSSYLLLFLAYEDAIF